MKSVKTFIKIIPNGRQVSFCKRDSRRLSLLSQSGVGWNKEPARLTVPEVISRNGYIAEVHNVTTSDGYVLQLHRIPCGRGKQTSTHGKRVVFLQHGLLGDSSNWIFNGVNNCLGYILADANYDVWLGNARGNTYSRRHQSLSSGSKRFWNFSFHEMGVFDLAADFDYVMNVTKTDGLYYIGHSMGSTMFWICMADRPEYNSKIKLMSALALIRRLAPHANKIEGLFAALGRHEFLPSRGIVKRTGERLCRENTLGQSICSQMLFRFCGSNPDQLDLGKLSLFVKHLPAGTSVRTLLHYAQGTHTGEFRQFHFGSKESNEKVYNQSIPPTYDLSRVTAPVAMYWGENDWLGSVQDTDKLAKLLPNVQRNYRIPDSKFNHLDFFLARDSRTLVADKVVEFMNKF